MIFRVFCFEVLVELSVEELDQWFRSILEGCGIQIGSEVIIYDVYRFLENSHLGIQLFLLEFLEITEALLARCQREDLAIDERIRFFEVRAQNLLEDIVDSWRASILLLFNSNCLGDTYILYQEGLEMTLVFL